MAQVSLNKTIEARKLNPKTLAPLPGPESSVPFGALIDRIERERDMARFRYQNEMYGCPFEVLAVALDAEVTANLEAAAPAATETAPSAPARPRIRWEQLASSGPAVMRARVPYGWLVMAGAALAFYPDPDHQWDGTSLPDPAASKSD